MVSSIIDSASVRGEGCGEGFAGACHCVPLDRALARFLVGCAALRAFLGTVALFLAPRFGACRDARLEARRDF